MLELADDVADELQQGVNRSAKEFVRVEERYDKQDEHERVEGEP